VGEQEQEQELDLATTSSQDRHGRWIDLVPAAIGIRLL
jgi:hypothetical protein